MHTIGGYRVLGELGRGSMGVVYRAYDEPLDREVAIKVLLQSEGPSDADRFRREAQATARLRHPSIVGVHSAGVVQGRPYLVMDLIAGESLGARLRRGALDPVEAARIVAQLARALQYAHERGVLHRDVKPQNILIDGQGRPHLTDFGLAKVLGRDGGRTAPGEILGTPAYMPPEQAGADLSLIGPRSDVYSLGATLYHLLSDRPPFQGSVIEVLSAVLEKAPPPLSSVCPGVDPILAGICTGCLAKNPEDRTLSASVLADELEDWLGMRRSTGAFVATEPAPGPGSSLAVATLALGLLLSLGIGAALGWKLQQNKALLAERERELTVELRGRRASVSALESRASVAEQARTDLATALAEQRRATARAHTARGKLLWRGARDTQARAALDQALEVDPGLAEAWYYRGVVRMQLKDRAGARTDMLGALRCDPKHVRAHANLVVLDVIDGQPSRALVLANRLLKELGPNAELYSGRASALERLNRLDEAERDLDRAIALQKTVGHFLKRAKVRIRRRRYREALADLDQTLQLSPRHGTAKDLRRRVLTQLGKTGVAKNDPRFRALLERASAQSKRRKLREAIATYGEALRLRPGDEVALLNRAGLLARVGLREDGLRDVERVIAKKPSDSAYYLRGEILYSLRRYEDAGLAFTRVLRLKPRDYWSWSYRAYCHIKLNRWTEAVRDLNQALKIRPRVRDLLARGMALIKLKKWQAAIQDFTAILASKKPDPRALSYRGVIYLKLGQRSQGLADLRRFLAENPKHAEARSVRRQLEKEEAKGKD